MVSTATSTEGTATTTMENKHHQRTKTFPWKLHEMLELADQEGFESIVSWLPNGRSFKVHSPIVFVEKIMPNFFQQTKYKSFQRQLNLWGFERLSSGPGKGGYFHPKYFIRENHGEICKMKRHKIKGAESLASGGPNTKINQPRPSSVASSTTLPKQALEKKSKTTTTTTTTEKTNKRSRRVSIESREFGPHYIADSNSDISSTSSVSINSDSFCAPVRPPETLHTVSSNVAAEFDLKSGDFMDFEGMSYFFVDDDEIATTTNEACNIDLLRNPPPPPAAGMASAPSAPVRQVSRASINMVSPMGSPSSTATTIAQPVPEVMVPALPAPSQVQSVIPSPSYLATANILSEISRRRVSVELSILQAAQEKTAAASTSPTPTSTAQPEAQQQEHQEKEQEETKPQQDEDQFDPTLDENWLIDDIIENMDWGDAEIIAP